MGVFKTKRSNISQILALDSPARTRRTTENHAEFDPRSPSSIGCNGANLSAGVAFGALGASKTVQDASKMVQDASKRTQDASKTAQDASRTLQDASKTFQVASKTLQD